VDEEFEIYAQLVDRTGLGVGPNDFRLSDMGGIGDPAYDGITPAVAYNRKANEYLVVWKGDDNVGGLVESETEVFSQRLDADLNGLGSNDFRLSDAGGLGDPDVDVEWGPDVTYNQITDRYMVVWGGEDTVDGMAPNEWEIFAQVLTSDIQGIGPNDERISDAGGLGDTLRIPYTPVVAANSWNGQFLVAWHGDDDVDSLVQYENEIFTQRHDGMAVFVDGFESGYPTAWDAVVQ
jgi:hypothetical protein